MISAPVEFLEWDSNLFGYRIARITTKQLDKASYQAIEAWSRANEIDCLYFLADSDDQATIEFVEKQAFRFVDIRMTYEWKVPQGFSYTSSDTSISIHHAIHSDSRALLAISDNAYQQSRFYADACFDRKKCANLYQTWLKQSIEDNYADTTLFAKRNHQAVGYITCHLNKPEGEGNIGLVGIAESAQGRGIGKTLLTYALLWFKRHDMKAVNVVTQGRNIAAQRLYQRSGFVTRSVELWYHKWLTNCAEK